MAFLLDTCVLSEGTHGVFDFGVELWMADTAEETRYASVVSLGELQYGILRLPHGKNRQRLVNWYQSILRPPLEGRLIPFGEPEAVMWAAVSAEYPNAKQADAQIAATALVHGLIVVTRNVKDFAFQGLSVFNPWRK